MARIDCFFSFPFLIACFYFLTFLVLLKIVWCSVECKLRKKRIGFFPVSHQAFLAAQSWHGVFSLISLVEDLFSFPDSVALSCTRDYREGSAFLFSCPDRFICVVVPG